MNIVVSPQTTLVIALGASRYPDYPGFASRFGDLQVQERAFKNAAEKLRTYFLNEFHLPAKNLLWLFDAPEQPLQICERIKEHLKTFAGKVTDVIVYFIGHGQDYEKQLYLALHSVKKEQFKSRCLKVEDLEESLRLDNVRLYYIFDCCYAGRAISDIRNKSSTQILCSSGELEEAIILPNGENTWFTGAFLKVLWQGEPSLKTHFLSFVDVARLLRPALDDLDKTYHLKQKTHIDPLPRPIGHRGVKAEDVLLFPNQAPRPVVHSPDQGERDIADVPLVLHIKSHKLDADWGTYRGRVQKAVFSSNSRFLASFRLGDPTIELWDLENEQQRSLQGHTRPVGSVAFSPDGQFPDSQFLASGSDDNTIKLWEVANGQELHTLTGHKDAVIDVVYSPDSRFLASYSWDRTLRLWDVAKGGQLHTIIKVDNTSNYVTGMAFSPDGQQLAGCGWDRIIKFWDVATGKELRTFMERGLATDGGIDCPAAHVAFSSDGRFLASWNSQHSKLWELASGQEVQTLQQWTRQSNWDILTLAFRHDGCRVASTLYPGHIHVDEYQ